MLRSLQSEVIKSFINSTYAIIAAHGRPSTKTHTRLFIHGIDRVTTAALVQDVEILRSAADRRDLLFAESLLIKSLHSCLNTKNKRFDMILKKSNINTILNQFHIKNLMFTYYCSSYIYIYIYIYIFIPSVGRLMPEHAALIFISTCSLF